MICSEYPKFKVGTRYGDKFFVQVKRCFWPFWQPAQDSYFGVTTYDTLEAANAEVKLIVKNLLADRISAKQAKASLTGEVLSVNEFIKKYPEEFL